MSAKSDWIKAGNQAAAEINLWESWKQELADNEPLFRQRSVVLELTIAEADKELDRIQAIKVECLRVLQERWDRDEQKHDEAKDNI